MNNLLLLILALATLCSSGQAQTAPINSPGQSYIGFAWGPGWSKQYINYEDAFDRPFQQARAFSFGLQLSFPASSSGTTDLQFELCLSQHGFRMEESAFVSGVNVETLSDARVRYLELPISVAHRIPLGGEGFELALMPGLNFGYAVSAKAVARGRGENSTRRVFTRIIEEVPLEDAGFSERLDAALLLGARLAYPFETGAAFAEARYHFGLLNLERNSEPSITEEGDKAFNRSLFLRLGYRFAL